jgi:hypothetical protein
VHADGEISGMKSAQLETRHVLGTPAADLTLYLPASESHDFRREISRFNQQPFAAALNADLQHAAFIRGQTVFAGADLQRNKGDWKWPGRMPVRFHRKLRWTFRNGRLRHQHQSHR